MAPVRSRDIVCGQWTDVRRLKETLQFFNIGYDPLDVHAPTSITIRAGKTASIFPDRISGHFLLGQGLDTTVEALSNRSSCLQPVSTT
jgi:hypothetical protein